MPFEKTGYEGSYRQRKIGQPYVPVGGRMQEVDYVLGYDSNEIRRSELQSRLLGPGTERVLRDAGVKPELSVLDIGSGAGDITMIATALVGPTGRVLGINFEACAVEHARARTRAAALQHVSLEMTTLDRLPPGSSFDVVMAATYFITSPTRFPSSKPPRALFAQEAA